MVEVGTTNKTHLSDYKDAITKNTGAIMVAHTSNYKVMGFTHSVDLADLGRLARKKRIPLIVDLGCGAIADFQNLNLPHEPSVLSYIKSDAGVYSFSGDKLLGGPQAGIICGKKTLIQKIHKNPLYRVLRCDKLTYAILEETLRTYVTPTNIHTDNLTMVLLQRRSSKLEKIAEKLLQQLSSKVVKKYAIEIRKTEVEAGSGSLPLEKVPSIALVVTAGMKASELGWDPLPASTSVFLISIAYFLTTLEDSCCSSFSAIFSSLDDRLCKRTMVRLSVWIFVGVT
jgi:L-seryl-tRNA(Ser) seleniumtransferase